MGVMVKKAKGRKRPLWLHNAKGSHKVSSVMKWSSHWWRVECEDGYGYTVPPDYQLWDKP